jgi:hypothetical protein
MNLLSCRAGAVVCDIAQREGHKYFELPILFPSPRQQENML